MRREAERFAPVFVLATARSYSSVIATMIGRHPELAGLPELKLFCCETVGELEAALPKYWRDRGVTHRSPGLVRALAELEFGGQSPEALLAARAWLRDRPHWTGAEVMDFLQERLKPRIAVEKSPDNLSTDASVERMAAAYPRARYLHLTRHPVTTQRSMRAYLKQTLPEYPQDGEPMNSIGSWYEIQRRILRFTAELPGDRYLRVRAEDVLNDGPARLENIARWLGVRTDAEAIEGMRHPEKSPFASPGTEASGGNDPGFLRDPVPRRVEMPATLEAPEGWAAEAGVWEMVVGLANRLGYF